jgi:hypothetical protein
MGKWSGWQETLVDVADALQPVLAEAFAVPDGSLGSDVENLCGSNCYGVTLNPELMRGRIGRFMTIFNLVVAHTFSDGGFKHRAFRMRRQTMAEKLSRSESWVCRGVAEFVAAGIFEVKRRFHRCSEIRLNPLLLTKLLGVHYAMRNKERFVRVRDRVKKFEQFVQEKLGQCFMGRRKPTVPKYIPPPEPPPEETDPAYRDAIKAWQAAHPDQPAWEAYRVPGLTTKPKPTHGNSAMSY